MAKRGRPKGSTYPDGPYLDQIADALTREPSKSANSAIMKIAGALGITDYRQQEAFRRRLHDKWSTQKEERLAEARERQRERTNAAFQQTAQSLADSAARMADTMRPILDRQRELGERIHAAMKPHYDKQAKMAARIEELLRPHREASARIAEITRRIQPSTDVVRLSERLKQKSAAAELLTASMGPLYASQLPRPNPFASTHPAGANAPAATRRGFKVED
ncbi:hypothetical protein ACSSNL_03425 [Thalassobius sp. S69A]|uniref:hypothetical protein n=1 Tax=unclassified Thalassovita TaxID=2619711 RepID=UPI003C7CA56A